MKTLFSRRIFFGLFAIPALGGQKWTPDNIAWQRFDADGSKYAVLDGDRNKPGEPFTYAFWMPDGLWVKAHKHSQPAHVAVMRGTVLLGYGNKMDRSTAIPVKAGEFFVVRANEAHFEGSVGETLIIGMALGSWKTTELE